MSLKEVIECVIFSFSFQSD